MSRLKKTCIAALLATLSAVRVLADDPPASPGYIAEAAAAVADAVLSAIFDFLIGLFKNLGEYVFGWIGDAISNVLNVLVGIFKVMILWNPDPYAVEPLVKGLMNILVPGYVLLITLVGMYFMFVASSPAGRARAKDAFLKLLFGMVLVSLSLEIYSVLLSISYAISLQVLSGVYFEGSSLIGALGTSAIGISVATGFTLPLTFLSILAVAGVSIGLRHFLVFLMAAIFPLTLFFYFFDFTKGIGSKLMRYTMLAIFTQVIEAFVLAVTILSTNAAGDSPEWLSAFLCMFIAMGGFAMLALAPLMMLGILQWIGTAMAMVGSVLAFVPGLQVVGGAMTAIGSVAAGMGPGGLIAGGTVYGLGKAYTGALSQLPVRHKTSMSAKREEGLAFKEQDKKDRQAWRHRRQETEDRTHEQILEEEDLTRYGATEDTFGVEDTSRFKPEARPESREEALDRIGINQNQAKELEDAVNKRVESFGAGISNMEDTQGLSSSDEPSKKVIEPTSPPTWVERQTSKVTTPLKTAASKVTTPVKERGQSLKTAFDKSPVGQKAGDARFKAWQAGRGAKKGASLAKKGYDSAWKKANDGMDKFLLGDMVEDDDE